MTILTILKVRILAKAVRASYTCLYIRGTAFVGVDVATCRYAAIDRIRMA